MRRRVLLLILTCLASSTFSLAQIDIVRPMEAERMREERARIDLGVPRRGTEIPESVECAFAPGGCSLKKPGGSLVHKPNNLFDVESIHGLDGGAMKQSEAKQSEAIRRLRQEILGTPIGSQEEKISLDGAAGTSRLSWRASERSSINIFNIFREAEKERLRQLNRENGNTETVKIEYHPEDFAQRFVVYNGGPGNIYEGPDVGKLIERLNGRLDQGGSPIVMEFVGFNDKEERAFVTEWSVQHKLVGHGSSWTPLTAASGDLVGDYQRTGIRLERIILTKEGGGWWSNMMQFAVGTRELWVRVWLNNRSLHSGFLGAYLERLLMNGGRLDGSAEQLVKRSKKQLLANHGELNSKQMYIDMRYEIGGTGLGELLIQERGPAGE
jgi:hypothetical protein